MKYSRHLVYFIWIVFCLFIWILSPIFDNNLNPGSQVQFVIRMWVLVGLICGLFLIGLVNVVRFKKLWCFHGFILIVTGIIIIYFIVRMINV